MTSRKGNPGLKGQLLDKSIEAYIVALETINRLSIKYRVETFAYLICNAWELLLKAKVLEDAQNNRRAIFYKQSKGQSPRSLSLRDCLNKLFPSTNDPIRRNVELVEQLRDHAVHLVISQVPKDVLALFQACVLNYHNRLNDWFGVSLSDRVSVGMMTIVYDLNPEQCDLSNKTLRRQMGADTAKYLMEFQADLKKEFNSLGKPAEFSIDISYKLALIKKPSGADIVLTTGGLSGTFARLVEVAKDSSKTHPYRQKDVISQVKAHLKDQAKVNQYDVQCVIKVFNVKQRPDFFYQGSVPGSPAQYSQAFIEWLVEQFNLNDKFFEKTRQQVKTGTLSS
jgi:hypothetical protein